jgi:hypothetical protein
MEDAARLKIPLLHNKIKRTMSGNNLLNTRLFLFLHSWGRRLVTWITKTAPVIETHSIFTFLCAMRRGHGMHDARPVNYIRVWIFRVTSMIVKMSLHSIFRYKSITQLVTHLTFFDIAKPCCFRAPFRATYSNP